MQICRVLHIREAISPFMFFSFYVTKNKKKISLGSARKSFTTNAQSAQMGNTPWQNFYFMFRLSKWPWLHMHLILERIFTSALVKKIELESCILITLTTISFPIYTYDFLWLKKKIGYLHHIYCITWHWVQQNQYDKNTFYPTICIIYNTYMLFYH